MFATDFMAFELEHIAQHPRTGKGMLQVQFINPPHQHQIDFGCGLRLVIDRRTRKLK
ncbi:hypothetical protein SDC9_209916 [bioreactor metagenome]|uniref:Uncharacterized protein n=1 Tax=bioreactor metagenome TaxID=1076179 RepID=A0A645JHJ8_9ZZZZ